MHSILIPGAAATPSSLPIKNRNICGGDYAVIWRPSVKCGEWHLGKC